MKTRIAVAGVVVVLVAVGAALLFSRHRPEWTTTSPQALVEFQKGLDSLNKVYYNEAVQHFQKALELDPNFVAAERFLLVSLQRPSSDDEVKKLFAGLGKADLSKLTDRERFLVSYTLADHAQDPVKAQRALQEYAARNPHDPFALEALANLAAARQDWPESRRLLTRLIEVAPNRVMAYNQLGYLEMGLGRFGESEKMFETYRYIAPDQANPHDSLGELYILIGRYDDARKELEQALRIRPDFCASYEHLADVALLDGRPGGAEEAITRAQEAKACPAYPLMLMRCRLATWPPFLNGQWEGVWQAEQSSCSDETVKDNVLAVWAALETGHRADAEAIVKKTQEKLAKIPPAAPGRRFSEAAIAHMEGALLLTEGKAAEAAERFRYADERMSYRELGPGLFKLINRALLARALQAAGSRDEAEAVLAEVRSVNAKFAERLHVVMASRPAN